MNPSLKLALDPVLTYWPRAVMFDFYQMVADSPADIVYIGKTVCSRRHELRLADWLDVADLLAASGGDTELGLLVKNTLDALDASAFDLGALLRPRGAGGGAPA